MYRLERVNALIQEILGEIFLEQVEWPEGVLATIRQVETSSDLKHTKIFLDIFPTDRVPEVKKLIGSLKGEIQFSLGQKIDLKWTPKLRFILEG